MKNEFLATICRVSVKNRNYLPGFVDNSNAINNIYIQGAIIVYYWYITETNGLFKV